MKILVLGIGKTQETYLQDGIAEYLKRLTHYASVEWQMLPDLKKNPATLRQRQEEEGQLLLKQLLPGDQVYLLDEGGRTYSSEGFAQWLEKQQHLSGRMVFCIGGAFGFSEAVVSRAQGMISLSEMTFSHQMVRLFFVEQLYRAFTIMKGEKYHHR